MQTDDELDRLLVVLRQRHAKATSPRAAMRACANALALCQTAGQPLPQWLYGAIMSYLHPITDQERRQWDDDKNAFERLEVLFSLLGDDETPTEKHFQRASEKLGSNGLSAVGVKKLWQRHGDSYLAAKKLKARREQ